MQENNQNIVIMYMLVIMISHSLSVFKKKTSNNQSNHSKSHISSADKAQSHLKAVAKIA